ncbi:uncharacterized protein DEA37_0001679 [Paragonimus westermani]|uniref:Uncharacterized protein n=1 Tax=Paragonimus westermani TaxID=34504 RepID=A0A5J4NG12_9TREM|nr:uncharacterized protein DEA37_0001679 [Paragonimus westermani]
MDEVLVGASAVDNIPMGSGDHSAVNQSDDQSKLVMNPEAQCAWCHKPRRQFKLDLIPIPLAGSDVDHMPICCSQVCFDQLRRAQFKHRRQANLPCADLPSLLTSGRPPYIPDSVDLCGGGICSSANVLTNSLGTMSSDKCQSLRGPRRRGHRTPISTKSTHVSSSSKTSLPSITEQEFHIQKDDIDMLGAHIAQSSAEQIVSSLFSCFPHFQVDSPSHFPLDTFVQNLLGILIGSNALSRINSHSANSQVSAGMSGFEEFTESVQQAPIILPVFLPIFKKAPEILQILERHGYHSRQQCPYACGRVNSYTQTIESGSQCPLIFPAHTNDDGAVLDLRIPRHDDRVQNFKRPSMTKQKAQCLLGKRRLNCFKMTDLQNGTVSWVKLTPTWIRRMHANCSAGTLKNVTARKPNC